MIRVAIFPCGSEAGLEIHNALQSEKNIQLFGASGVRCHGEAIFENYDCTIPFIDHPDFEEQFNAYLDRNKIDYVFPAYDDVIIKFAEMGDRLKARAVQSTPDVCNVARFKSATYQALEGLDFCPKYSIDNTKLPSFPLFAKPDQGQGSQGIMKLATADELTAAAGTLEGLVFCEFLSGPEYTIDCFTDRNGKLQVCAPRVRQRMKSGIAVRTASKTLTPRIKDIAEKILERIPFRGVWFFQLKEDAEGNLKLLEVAPRIAGSMATTRARGMNLPLMAIYDCEGFDVTAFDNDVDVLLERFLGNRFLRSSEFKTVYIDFDDTITHQGRTNIDIMRFIYHCINNAKRVVLITRHAKDLTSSLAHHRISSALFDEIIHITDKSPKSEHIKPDQAIFIDDSFAERKDVHDRHAIPVYSVDAVESLIDWRHK